MVEDSVIEWLNSIAEGAQIDPGIAKTVDENFYDLI